VAGMWRVDPEVARSSRPADAYDVVDDQDMLPVHPFLANLTHAIAYEIAEAHNAALLAALHEAGASQLRRLEQYQTRVEALQVQLEDCQNHLLST